MTRAITLIISSAVLLGCGKSSSGSGGSAAGSEAPPKPSPASPIAPAARPASGDMMDHMWENQPEAGKANVRLLVQDGGSPFHGDQGMHGRFKFTAVRQGGMSSQNSFNPNANGRYVYDGLDPGTYRISVEDSGKTYKPWTKESVELKAGAVETFTLDLAK